MIGLFCLDRRLCRGNEIGQTAGFGLLVCGRPVRLLFRLLGWLRIRFWLCATASISVVRLFPPILRLAVIAIVLMLCLTRLLAITLLAFLLLALFVHLALRFAQQPCVMFRMLLKIFDRNPVIAQMRIARQLIIFVDNLLGRTAHLAFGTRAVKNPVDDITARLAIAIRARFRART